MISPDRADLLLSRLEREALTGFQAESFQSVQEDGRHRLGVSVEVRGDRFVYSIELMLRLFCPDGELDLPSLTARALWASKVQERGYSVVHLNQGWVCGVREVQKKDVARELAELEVHLNGIP
jgi:hypothetical protein